MDERARVKERMGLSRSSVSNSSMRERRGNDSFSTCSMVIHDLRWRNEDHLSDDHVFALQTVASIERNDYVASPCKSDDTSSVERQSRIGWKIEEGHLFCVNVNDAFSVGRYSVSPRLFVPNAKRKFLMTR